MKKLLIGLMAFTLSASQVHAMEMKTAKTVKKENSSTTCCCITTLCGLAAAYSVMTSGQSLNAPQPSIMPVGQSISTPQSTVVILRPCPLTSDSEKLEPGYAAASWSDFVNVRNRNKQAVCHYISMDEDEQEDLLEKYKNHHI
jgi:hypothetical protein